MVQFDVPSLDAEGDEEGVEEGETAESKGDGGDALANDVD